MEETHMRIASMFKKDINREISGVVQVGQDDQESLHQELSEYIVTRELRRHFNTFIDNYSRAFDKPTNQVGVWISGFFGSGKSHFLKILSYILSGREVAGKKAVDYFEEKFDDPMMFESLVRCTLYPTESILFNIDREGPSNKDKTVILRIFAKVFYNHLGYYGEDLKVVRLERFLQTTGKTEAFHRVFEEINGEPWVEARMTYAFFEDDVVATLQETLGMSETAARNWFNNTDREDISIKLLVEDIKEYVDSKGKDFRLLFCVDEVGQYIGDDGDLMINLQTFVEEVGSQCRGQVWVMVTSQEAIDSVVRITGDGFSKIQGRFNTHLSLSSESVDEVIKQRILDKEPEAEQYLKLIYEKEQAVLKNLFTFTDAVLDIKGYRSDVEYAATYPFVPYQFIIMQKAFAEIRKHGHAGKHLSGRERSMLSAFQEAAQDVQDQDQYTLVPFSQFYNTVHSFLEGHIRQSIDRCELAAYRREGVEPQDVDVLKNLYLIRYVDDFKANIDNLAIMMIRDVRADKIRLRQEIGDSLKRLEQQNYVARTGDTYAFLTDDEQDIARDIQNTPVDSERIVKMIGETAFNNSHFFPPNKYRYDNNYDFAFDRFVDDYPVKTPIGGIRVRLITVASDNYRAPKEEQIMVSKANNEAIIVLSQDAQYFSDLEKAAKIRKFVQTKNLSTLSDNAQEIIGRQQKHASTLEQNASAQIGKAILEGDYYVHGVKVDIKGKDVKTRVDEILSHLIRSVYQELNLVNSFYSSEDEIKFILSGAKEQDVWAGTGANNEYALHDINRWLESRSIDGFSVTMGELQKRYQAIPYGWKEIDIAALVARLLTDQTIEIRYGGAVVAKDDKHLVDYLRKRSLVDMVEIRRRISPSEEDLRRTAQFLKSWLGKMDIPDDEERLVAKAIETLTTKLKNCDDLLSNYDQTPYPEQEAIQSTKVLLEDILSHKDDHVAFLKQILQRQDDLMDATEDMEDIRNFFKTNQRNIFDEAKQQQEDLKDDRLYLDDNPDIYNKIRTISSILGMKQPYNKIKDLPELMQEVRKAHEGLLEARRKEVAGTITSIKSEIHSLAGIQGKTKDEVRRADERLGQFMARAQEATSLVVLNALIEPSISFRDQSTQRIMDLLDDKMTTRETGPGYKSRQIKRINRSVFFPARQLTSQKDVDDYLEHIKKQLYESLKDSDEIQIL